MARALMSVVLVFAGLVLVSCGRPGPVLSVEGGSLVLRRGGSKTVLLAAVPPDVAPSGAYVRLAHEIVSSGDGTRAVALLTVGRRTVALPACIGEGGRVTWGAGIEVPRGTRAILSPLGDAFLLVSTRDLRLPKVSPYLLNRGAMLLAFDDRPHREEVAAALSPDDPGPWYGSPELRYVSPGEFEVEEIEWRPGGCRLAVREEDGTRRVIPLGAV